MNIIVNNTNSELFGVRMVWKGQPYGRMSTLVHNDDDPLVEFWDLRRVAKPTLDFPTQPGAQHVARYHASVLRKVPEGRAFDLHGGVPAWQLDGPAMTVVRRFIEVQLEAATGAALPR